MPFTEARIPDAGPVLGQHPRQWANIITALAHVIESGCTCSHLLQQKWDSVEDDGPTLKQHFAGYSLVWTGDHH